MKKLRIIGVGNPLMGDDGVGVAAVERLAELSLPEGVEAVDGGTGGVTLLSLMEGWPAVFLIDAVDMGASPGMFRRLPVVEGILAQAETRTGASLHALDLGAVLALGRELGLLPPALTLFGIQPARIAPGTGLSEPVRSALEDLIEEVAREIRLRFEGEG